MRPHRQQPTRFRCPWDSPGKNTGVGCHCLLQINASVQFSRSVVSDSATPWIDKCLGGYIILLSEDTAQCSVMSDSSWPMDCSPPRSSVHGIFQVKILEWLAISSSRWSTQLRDQIRFSCISLWILYHWAPWQALVLRQGRFKYILGRGLIE